MNLRLPLLALSLVTVACVGGGGGLSQSLETQDRPPITNEGVSNSSEGYRSTLDPAGNSLEMPSSRGESSPTGGGFSCGGTYRCALNGQEDNDDVVLLPSGNGCAIVSDGDGAMLQSDGTIVEKGRVIGNWTSAGSGFSFSASSTSQGKTTTLTVTCNKVSDSTVPRAKDDKPSTGSSGGSGSSSSLRDGG